MKSKLISIKTKPSTKNILNVRYNMYNEQVNDLILARYSQTIFSLATESVDKLINKFGVYICSEVELTEEIQKRMQFRSDQSEILMLLRDLKSEIRELSDEDELYNKESFFIGTAFLNKYQSILESQRSRMKTLEVEHQKNKKSIMIKAKIAIITEKLVKKGLFITTEKELNMLVQNLDHQHIGLLKQLSDHLIKGGKKNTKEYFNGMAYAMDHLNAKTDLALDIMNVSKDLVKFGVEKERIEQRPMTEVNKQELRQVNRANHDAILTIKFFEQQLIHIDIVMNNLIRLMGSYRLQIENATSHDEVAAVSKDFGAAKKKAYNVSQNESNDKKEPSQQERKLKSDIMELETLIQTLAQFFNQQTNASRMIKKEKQLIKDVKNLLKRYKETHDPKEKKTIAELVKEKIKQHKLLRVLRESNQKECIKKACTKGSKKILKELEQDIIKINKETEQVDQLFSSITNESMRIAETETSNTSTIRATNMVTIKANLKEIDQLIDDYKNIEIQNDSRRSQAMDKLRTKLAYLVALKLELNKMMIKSDLLIKETQVRIDDITDILQSAYSVAA